MKKLLAAAFMIVILWQLTAGNDEVTLGPGIKAPDVPVQQVLNTSDSFQLNAVTITPLAEFRLTAKILAKEKYYFGDESNISPVDLALGWGEMSDESVLESIEISQSGRWYRWYVNDFPIARRAIETQSANMHMIPADSGIEARIDNAKRGQLIQLQGYLVRADGPDNWYWQSSMTRSDTGNGACELVYVTHFDIIK